MKSLLFIALFATTTGLLAEPAAYQPYTGVDTVAPSQAPVATAIPAAYPTAVPAAYPAANPAAYPTAYPTAAPAAYPAANPAAVATAYPTPWATAVPTANPVYRPYVAPTPVATPLPNGTKVATVSFYKPRWGLALKGGGMVPLGDLALYNTSGAAGNLNLLYLPNDWMTINVFSHYSSQGYKLGGGASALTLMGGGLKLDFEIMRVEALSASVGAGAGYMAVQRTQQVVVGQNLGLPIYSPATQNTGGIALLFGFSLGYDFSSHWGLIIDLNVINLSLSGGTSDSLMIANPGLGMKYIF